MLKLRTGVHATETDYGVALLDENTGQYWTLNPTAAVVLRTLFDGGAAEQAAEALTREYDVDAAGAERDVQDLLGELQSAGLLEATPAGRPS